MRRRSFLSASGLALAQDRPVTNGVGQTVVVYREGANFRAIGLISRVEIASGSSAARVIQAGLDNARQTGGGKLTLEPGVYTLDRPLRIYKNTSLAGSGMSTILKVTPANKEGIGILGEMADRCTIMDLRVDGHAKSPISIAGLVLDNCSECAIERVMCRSFQKYGFVLRNQSAFTKLHGCMAANNQESNFRLERLNGWREARIGSFVPNLVNNCYAYGGGHGFDISRAVCQNIVGCEVYQAKGVGFYVRDGATSILISGCRSFQGKKQAVLVENADEMNISSSVFCWHEGHGIELTNCTWGTISANEIMDSGAGSSDGPKFNVYLHTDVKGMQVTGNSLFTWADQLPTKSGIFEDAECSDNNIVGNTINYCTEQGVVSKGKNSVAANNLVQATAYPNPGGKPFAKPSKTYMHPQGPFTMERLEAYFRSSGVSEDQL